MTEKEICKRLGIKPSVLRNSIDTVSESMMVLYYGIEGIAPERLGFETAKE